MLCMTSDLLEMQLYAPHIYLGANDTQQEGNFVWVSTGQPLSYSNWSPSEPNDGGLRGNEDCVALEFYSADSKWFWNDMCCTCSYRPVVCEYWPYPVIMMTSSNGNILIFSSICARINGRVNTREAGDLRRHHAHYDVTVMWFKLNSLHSHCRSA